MEIVPSLLQEAEKVTSGSTIIDSGTLTNEGEFVSNGPFKKEKGTFINKGTISGNGSLPDDLKQKPDSITGYTAEISENYKENMSINVPSLAGIHKPVNQNYMNLLNTGSDKGEGTINEETGQLTVERRLVYLKSR